MTPIAMRIAIAEACGWKDQDEQWEGFHVWKFNGNTFYGQRSDKYSCLPNYPHDLNAMREAAMMLTEQQKWNYGNTLALMVLSKERAYFGEKEDAEPNLNGYGHFALATLTAMQHAEAFVEVTSGSNPKG